MDMEMWINKAILSIGKISVGEAFTLKDLFTGTEWKQLSAGEVRDFGRKFKSSVLNEKIPGISHVGKAKNGSNLYRKEE